MAFLVQQFKNPHPSILLGFLCIVCVSMGGCKALEDLLDDSTPESQFKSYCKNFVDSSGEQKTSEYRKVCNTILYLTLKNMDRSLKNLGKNRSKVANIVTSQDIKNSLNEAWNQSYENCKERYTLQSPHYSMCISSIKYFISLWSTYEADPEESSD